MTGKYQINNQSEKRFEYKNVEKARRNLSLFTENLLYYSTLQKVSKNIIFKLFQIYYTLHTTEKNIYNLHEYIITITEIIFI